MIDDRIPFFPAQNDSFIRHVCHRQKGIGADGVILLQKGTQEKENFKMRIFNADGFEAEMCGNGLRCLAKYIQELGFNVGRYTVETMGQNLEVEIVEDAIKTSMPTPLFLNKTTLELDGTHYECTHLDTGVPHAVIFVKDLESIPVLSLGKKIRFHPFFSPKGANANFVQRQGEHSFLIRTYERGVESETLACGTGCAAAAASAWQMWNLTSPIHMTTRSNEILTIDFVRNAQGDIASATQTGPAVKTFQGYFKGINDDNS